MKSDSSIKKNLIYNIAYQMLILILPIVTVPYVSRVLGAGGIGIYSYTYSIVNYFMLIGMLGINNYGNRTIAKSKNDKEKLSQNFFAIYKIQVLTTLLMIIFYTIYLIIVNQYKLIFVIQSIYLISTAFDINWFFFGMEKFKITVTRNTIIKMVSLGLILIFVKTENDLWKYTLIMASSTLLGQLALLPFLKEEVIFKKTTFSDIKKHLKPCLTLFIPVVAVSLYKIMDKTMLGFLTDVKEVGYYEQSEKIINIPMGIITALGTVMLPRISNLLSTGNDKLVKDYIEKSIKFMMFLAFPICLGLITVSHDFVPIFLGNDFSKSAILINLLSCTIIFISFANIIRTQYLIPNERDKEYIISVLIGALANFVINLLLIPKLASIGACIGTVIAEFVVMAYQTYSVRKEIEIKKYIVDVLPFLRNAVIMFIIIQLVNMLNINTIIKLCIQILLGIIIYGVLNFKYINSIVDIKQILLRKSAKDE